MVMIGTMGSIQFAYLAILAAVVGAIAVPINNVRINSEICDESFIFCPEPSILVDGCWVCTVPVD